GPNDKLGFCCIGVNGRGTSHLGAFQGNETLNTEVVAICDVDSDVGHRRCESVAAKQGGRKPTYYQDIRKALEDPAVDCVSIATPWPPFGPCSTAKMCMSKNRSATTSMKGSGWWKLRASTTKFARPAPNRARPVEHSRPLPTSSRASSAKLLCRAACATRGGD